MPYQATPLIEGPLDPWGYASEDRSSTEAWMERRRRAGGTVFRPTTDDWHRTWPGGLVAIIHFFHENGTGRISISGTDDTSMEIDLPTHEATRRMVLRLPLIVSRADLTALGFVRG